jgi:hypothetical protein
MKRETLLRCGWDHGILAYSIFPQTGRRCGL